MQFASKYQNNTRNILPILKKNQKVVSFMVVLLLVLKLGLPPTPKGAILDLSNMAATAGAQLGSLEKLACYGHIYLWSKIGACRPIWTIKVFLKIKPPD